MPWADMFGPFGADRTDKRTTKWRCPTSVLEESHLCSHKAADVLGLSSKLRGVLLSRFRVVNVELITEGDDGQLKHHFGYRVQHNRTRGPANSVGCIITKPWFNHPASFPTTTVAFSPNGVHWAAAKQNPVLKVYSDANQVVLHDAKIIYYCGVHGAHTGPKVRIVVRKHRVAIGLVTLRRDGFVSLEGGQEAATMLTKPFRMPAGELHVNSTANSQGRITAAFCHESGRPIKEFSESEPVTGDICDETVSPVRSFIVVFRSAKARSFRGAKGDYRTVIPRTILRRCPECNPAGGKPHREPAG